MKKILLLIVAPFVFLSALPAQITQKEADEIVLERLSQTTQLFTVYAKENIQTEGITITASEGEVIELGYACWIYYINYTNNAKQYIAVKESDGNLLEVYSKEVVEPEDLKQWRVVLDMTAIDFNNIEKLYEQPLPVIKKCVQGKWQIKYRVGGRDGMEEYSASKEYFIEIDGNKMYGEETQWKKYALQGWYGSFETYGMKEPYEEYPNQYPNPLFLFLSIDNDFLYIGYSAQYNSKYHCPHCYIGELWVRAE